MKTIVLRDNANSEFAIKATDGKLEISAEGLELMRVDSFNPELWRKVMAEETRRDWEVIQENASDKTERLRVKNGFLYRVVSSTGVIALTFVPGND
jgi:hypothetical protein